VVFLIRPLTCFVNLSFFLSSLSFPTAFPEPSVPSNLKDLVLLPLPINLALVLVVPVKLFPKFLSLGFKLLPTLPVSLPLLVVTLFLNLSFLKSLPLDKACAFFFLVTFLYLERVFSEPTVFFSACSKFLSKVLEKCNY
tara:strand:+ start:269 stop:685 length:417 start_codon:yes stop_codon:yes gene_type:complete